MREGHLTYIREKKEGKDEGMPKEINMYIYIYTGKALTKRERKILRKAFGLSSAWISELRFDVDRRNTALYIPYLIAPRVRAL